MTTLLDRPPPPYQLQGTPGAVPLDTGLFAAPEGPPGTTGTAAAIATLLTDVIRRAAANAPRSLQTALGPSEIGTPCPRRIGHRLAHTPPVNTDTDPLASIIGTAVHAWLAEAFETANDRDAPMQWLVEQRLEIVRWPDGSLTGSGDLFHVPTATVLDWKIPGPTSMREAKTRGPSDQYRVQVHTYGVGYLRRGLVPRHVAIAYLPRAGRLDGIHVWSEPFDPAVAADALTRLDTIRTLVTTTGPAALPLLPRVEAHCPWCPFWRAGTDPTDPAACPGPDPHPTQAAATATAPNPAAAPGGRA